MTTLDALTLRPRLIVAFLLAAGLAFVLPATLPIWSKALCAW